MIIKDKKGGEKYLSLWWFFTLIIILAAIVGIVLLLSLSDVSTKEMESEVLISRIFDCAVEQGRIEKSFLDTKNIFTYCNINRELFDENEHFFYYAIYSLDKCGGNIDDCKPEKEEFIGLKRLEKQCDIRARGVRAENYPSCIERKIYVLSPNEERMVFYIKSGSNQVIRS